MTAVLDQIQRDYEQAEAYALDCVLSYKADLAIAEPNEQMAIQEDCRDAYRVLFEEAVLLEVFRETDETAESDTKEVMSVAKRKIMNDSYVDEVVDFHRKKLDVPEELTPALSIVRSSVRRAYRRINYELRFPERAKVQAIRKRRRKRMTFQEASQRFFEEVLLGDQQDEMQDWKFE